MASRDHILYLNGPEVQAIVMELDTIALIEEVFRLHGSGETILPDEAYLGWKTESNETVRSLNMPSYVGGAFRMAGTKIINSNPANRKRGLPRASGLTLLFDPETVRICCMMEGAYISAIRTASVSILCIKKMGKRDLRSIAIIGAGTIGKAHAEVAAKTFESLEQIVLFDLNPSSAETLASTLRSSIHTKVEIQVAKTARDSVHDSDAVVAATTVTSGYIPYDWLLPSCIFVNVSLDDLLPEVFLKADLLVVDDWNLIQADSKRLLGKMYRERRIVGPKDTSSNGATRRVDAEIGDLVLGRHPGRRKAEDIIVVNPFGLAIEDIAFASKVLEVAKSRKIGTLLPV